MGLPENDIYTKEIKNVRREINKLRTALIHIASGGCHKYTIGNCWENGHIIDTIYSDERVCDYCIAKDALSNDV